MTDGEVFVFRRVGAELGATRISGLAEAGRWNLVIAADSADEAGADDLIDALERELEQSAASPGSRMTLEKRPDPEADWSAIADGDPSLLVALSGGARWIEAAWQEPFLANERVLPMLPLTEQPRASQIFGARLRKINVAFWRNGVAEVVSAVLARLGLTDEIPRLFISYRRKEAQALANQLFDALSQRNFDVFLDHFRVPPGVEFQRRLTQEIGDKSVVLVIESAAILTSEWTRYEISTALLHGLGLIGIGVPGGRDVPGIDATRRMRLKDGDFVGGSFSAAAELEPKCLEDLVVRVVAEHDRALRRRYEMIRRSLEVAFGDEGLSLAAEGRDAFVTEFARDANTEKFRVRICRRSPELQDFHTVEQQCAAFDPADRGLVVGATALMETPRSERLRWLSGKSKMRLYDVGEVARAAREIKQGGF
jgi:hypothetical protein